jgi:SAM-dependent methyltransferase
MDAKKYIEDNIGKGIRFKDWIDNFLAHLEKDAVILDVGSGLGYNADYMESKGFNVIRSDIDQVFIDFQKKPVKRLDILSKMDGKYEAIFMCLLISMFAPSQLDVVISNIKESLKPGGVVAFNVPLEWAMTDIYKLCEPLKYEFIKVSRDMTWWFVIVRV